MVESGRYRKSGWALTDRAIVNLSDVHRKHKRRYLASNKMRRTNRRKLPVRIFGIGSPKACVLLIFPAWAVFVSIHLVSLICP